MEKASHKFTNSIFKLSNANPAKLDLCWGHPKFRLNFCYPVLNFSVINLPQIAPLSSRSGFSTFIYGRIPIGNFRSWSSQHSCCHPSNKDNESGMWTKVWEEKLKLLCHTYTGCPSHQAVWRKGLYSICEKQEMSLFCSRWLPTFLKYQIYSSQWEHGEPKSG